MEFSPDGNRLLTTSYDGTARVWDLVLLADKEPSLRLESPIFGAALSEDGKQILAGSKDGTIRRINLATLREEPPLMPALGDRKLIRALAFDGSGRQWAAALAPYEGNATSYSVGLWRQHNDQISRLELSHPQAVAILAFNMSGSRLATVADDVSIRVWNTSEGTLLHEIYLPNRAPRLAGVSPDGRMVVVSLV